MASTLRLHSARKLPLPLLAGILSTSALLSGCETLLPGSSLASANTPPSVQTGTPALAASDSTPSTVANNGATPDSATTVSTYSGRLHFILKDTGWGNDSGWQIQVSNAARNQGLMPFISRPMEAGQSLMAELWPDEYHVQVLQDNATVAEHRISILPGQASVVYVDIMPLGFQRIHVLYGDAAAPHIQTAGTPSRSLNIVQTFQPMTVTLRPGLQARYYGPQQQGKPTGSGRLKLLHNNREIALVENAQAVAGGFQGTPVFKDKRQIIGFFQPNYALAASALMQFADGRIFQGTYTGLEPRQGTMREPDGSSWTGTFQQRKPQGTGRLTLENGLVVLNAPGSGASNLDGAYACILPNGQQQPCFYDDGVPITEQAYQDLMAARGTAAAPVAAAHGTLPSRATATRTATHAPASAPSAAPGLAASSAAAPASQEPAAPPAPPPTASKQGCAGAQGIYTTTTDLSRLRLDSNNRGSLWQKTYGGQTFYTFEISFTYRATPDSMRFDYEEGIYRDASGTILRRVSLPGGDAKCSYNGRELNIGGTSYFRK